MKKSLLRMLCLVLCLVTLVGMLPVTAMAATTLGTPKNPMINKAYDYQNRKLVTKYGAVTWQAASPVVLNGVTSYEVSLYRNNQKFYSQNVGYPNLKAGSYVTFDLSPFIETSGTYHVGVRAVSNSSKYGSSKTVTTSSWKYTRPTAKMEMPTNPGWMWPDALWEGEEVYNIMMYYSPTKVTNEDNIEDMCSWFHTEWNIRGSANGNSNRPPYGDFGPGYYRFRVRTMSPNLTKYRHSDWLVSDVYHFQMDTPVARAENAASTGKPKIIWNGIQFAVKYEVYRATGETGSYERIKTTTNKYYTDATAVPGTSYRYKVRAVTETGAKSSFSDTVRQVCKLARPDVTISNVASTGKIKLSWNTVSGAAEYEIYRRAEGVEEYELFDIAATNSYTDTSMAAGEKYYYRVRAIQANSDAASALSETVAKVCDLARPTVSIKLSSSGKPTLIWKAVPNAVEYKVYRASSKTGKYSLIKTTNTTNCTNLSAKAGMTYYYKVQAIHPVTSAVSAYSTVKYIKSK